MYLTRILLSIVFVLFASTALAAKPGKILVCHVGNEYGPEGQIYDPTCEPDEFYDCSADAGKVDLILVSEKAKHVGNEAHTFEDDTGYLWEDYSPEEGIGDDPADFEEGDVDGIDRGCELEEELLACNDIRPISALFLVWDGPDGIVVITELGQVINGIVRGDVISVNTLGGDNDINISISGAVIGESEFHISCSDRDMNGPEDCGALQGNSKSNDFSLINNWLFVGMEGDGGILDCVAP